MVSSEPAKIRRAAARYAAEHDAYVAATEAYVALVTQLLDDAGIDYLDVTSRTKSIDSYAGKLSRRVDGRLVYPDPVRDITDQIGIRVITYVLGDVRAVVELLADQLVILEDRDMGRETAAEGRWGYASRHLLVGLDPVRARAKGPLRGRKASVQIRTVLQHAWAEFEHDIRYKGSVPEAHAPDFDRRFTLAAGLLELADQQFTAIRDRHREEVAPPVEPADDDPRIGSQELSAFLAGQFADAGWSRTDHYAWVSGLLLELGITSLTELRDLLRSVDTAEIEAKMGYRYPPGAVRRLDDALLSVFGEKYVALHGNAHRTALLQTRLEKLSAASP
ncbi:GTP pyrophosphokinase [Ornithinimicrobium pratense]|uniref:GTP pyrophosphokinase n=1 Tax=Ornithinimicrobium pratense TaxID=2593973 RepID=A0A5J6V2J4_9MICO|nr:GTP pyrophosphokinase [Ornithinimicrobium pratense]QFG68089.1 GTP pyrophosphokinase [Ornithinimicrobium pratense]